jgi:DNA polymerase IV
MSVLCCQISDFLLATDVRERPQPEGRPLALLGPDGRVWAASPEAQVCGVRAAMTPRQTLARCPDAAVRDLDLAACEHAQRAFVGSVAEFGLPVEEQTWGSAFVDLRPVADQANEVQPLCAEVGRRIRQRFQQGLQPALGWDSGKFTAQAAAARTAPGRMLLVDRQREAGFLGPLPIQLLPLPAAALQYLGWLGIRTMGQFGRLPASAVMQRFGTAGKLAQRLAQGRDDRAVQPTTQVVPTWHDRDFDPPTASRDEAAATALAALQPELAGLAQQFKGMRHVRVELRFLDRSTRAHPCTFVEPAAETERLRATLLHALQSTPWPAELAGLRIAVLETGDLLPQQLTLFPELDAAPERSPLAELVDRLGVRYGNLFFRGAVVDEQHPVAERRIALSLIGARVAG